MASTNSSKESKRGILLDKNKKKQRKKIDKRIVCIAHNILSCVYR